MTGTRIVRLLVLLGTHVIFSMAQDNKTCYFPDGLPAENQNQLRPCDSDPNVQSACCIKDAVCLSNGLCYQQDDWGGRIARSGCTVSDWSEAKCATYCKDVARAGGINVMLAKGYGKPGGGMFCCGPFNTTTEQCTIATDDHGFDPFTIDRGYVLFPNTSLTLQDFATAHGLAEDGSTTSTSSASSSSATSSPSNGSNLGLGVGLGIGLGLPLILAVACCSWLWRKNQALVNQLGEKPQAAQYSPAFHFAHEQHIPAAPPKIAVPSTELAFHHHQQQLIPELSHEQERQELDARR
ncbi:hypothetical protein AC578_5479 [Pseudocercospora eumusae]|uniref:Mid2 domain-containing protein n=1 Tax=Pseudocercospora eumusae TaxID=321146 RepID=A0A139H1D8_9PEZI|nr:hypothetical protein AC578_5479 [Pseudocercospora eumusae]